MLLHAHYLLFPTLKLQANGASQSNKVYIYPYLSGGFLNS